MSENGQHNKDMPRIKECRRPAVRFFFWVCGILLSFVVLASLALGGLYLRLKSGPLSFPGLTERVVAALSPRFESDWGVQLNDSALELDDHGSFALRVHGLTVRDTQGRPILRAPDAVISVDTFSLMFARLNPRLIDFRDLQAVGTINTDGSVTFVPAEEALPEPAIPVAPQAGERAQEMPASPTDGGQTIAVPRSRSRLSQAVEGFLDIVVGQEGPIGALDRAQFTNLRLTLIDTQRRVRAHFTRIDAKFERTSDNGRSFEARLDGSRGSWSLRGDAQPIRKGYQLVFYADDVPVQDVLFLSGMSTLPVQTTLKVSGRANISMSKGILQRFEGSFGTGEGRIDVQDKDATPLFVNSSTLAVNWDEAQRTMSIGQLEFQAGDTHVLMKGDAVVRYNEPWRLNLAADNAVLSGVTTEDAPVVVDRLEAEVSGNGGINLERLYVKGPDLDATIKAKYGFENDPKAISVEANANNTALRSVLRLWPEITASSPRRYLVGSLRGGLASRALVKVQLSGDELKQAMNGGSIPDSSLLVDIDVRNGEFLPTPGLPVLSKASVKGVVTGRSANVQGKDAVIELEDGRSLNVPAASFEIDDFWPKTSVATILADADGSADALASFLRLPKIQEAFSWEVDPVNIKGKANLQLNIGLALNNIPKFSELPVAVEGKLTDVTLEKAIGAERLEKATFAVNYDTGALTMKGDGQLAGYPATINVSQKPHEKGTGLVQFTLDDAARARKGLNFGSQLTGIMPVKVTLSLEEKEKNNYQVEADLTKLSINNLIPGWVKPAGRAAKLSLVAKDTGDGTAVSDLRLDSGSVRFAGQAMLDGSGELISADLSSFQLSQGDSLQAKVDKAGDIYKVTLRGNVGDARPIIRALSSNSDNGRGNTASRNSSGMNVDLDGAVNILTGFNDEALTKSTLKLAIRNGSVRQINLNARIGSAPLSAQTSQKGNTTLLYVQAANAGSVMRYLDVYRRMHGGDLMMEGTLGDGAQSGYIMLRNFMVRNEPALKRIVPSQTQIENNRSGGSRRIDVNEASFTKARVDFIRNGGRIDFRDAAIWGTQIGFTLDGYLDISAKSLDISGTFVPAYGLNNAFAQVPILGTILGGGQYGGLFGVNFRMSGPIASPAVTVNPLSAVAPGIFRKLFGAAAPNAPVMPDVPSNSR